MDKSRVEPTIFFIEKISFSLKIFFGHFYGQSFIKTVRGPLSSAADVIGALRVNTSAAYIQMYSRLIFH